MRFDLYAAVRGPGKPFANVQHCRRLRGHRGRLFREQRGRDRAQRPRDHRLPHAVQPRRLRCRARTTIGEAKTVVAVAQVKADGTGSFAAQVLAGGGNVDGLQPRVTAGTDGRLAASWVQLNGCGNAND